MACTLAERYLETIKRSLLNEMYPELEAQLLYAVLCIAHGQPLTLDALWSARHDETLAAAIRAARAGGDTLVLRGRDALGNIVDRPDLQIVLVDTPGIHRPRTALGERLNALAADSLTEAEKAVPPSLSSTMSLSCSANPP